MLRARFILIATAAAGLIATVSNGCGYLQNDCAEDKLGCGDGGGGGLDAAPLDATTVDVDSSPNYACCDGSEDSDAATPEDGGSDGGTCGPGTTSCAPGQGCVDLSSSVANCGACGHTCTAPPNGTPTCKSGSCGIQCSGSLELCNGACVDPTSTASCGGCNACSVPDGGYAVCDAGACVPECNVGLTDCTGACVDTTHSVAHCSANCQPCTTTQANAQPSCSNSTCGFTCNPNWFACNGTCHSTTAGPTDPCYVTEQFGVFVATNGSDATGNGTRAAPYATMGYAVQHAGGLPNVFTCQGTYPGQVSLGSSSPAITIYGGFNCSSATWTYAASAPQMVVVQPPAGTIPLVINSVTAAVTIANMTFKAANASGQDSAGNGLSSVAVFANASPNITMKGVSLQAGSAANGNGNTPPGANYSGGTAPAGESPQTGDAGTTAPGSLTCGDGTTSSGGAGGPTSPALGGANGSSNPVATTTPGYDGAGGGGGASVTSHCGFGNDGAQGAPGAMGNGALSWGTLSSTGWTPASGADGHNGSPGEGGGGGGGATLPLSAGASGGSGGCGGAGGHGGGGGGSSFALLALNSPVSLVSCTLSTSNAGSGGAGGAGQAGQSGGNGGVATLAGACSGGYGGNGGGGGGAGGGAAGLSVGVAYVGSSVPLLDSVTTFTGGGVSGQSTGGSGGGGGSNPVGSAQGGQAGSGGKAGSQAKLQVLN